VEHDWVFDVLAMSSEHVQDDDLLCIVHDLLVELDARTRRADLFLELSM
jgi:hypothetical protein